MNAMGHNEQERDGRPEQAARSGVVWAVVTGDIGPLLLAATETGLVTVVFHATDAVRDKALERLASRLGINRQVLRELATGVPFGTVVGYGDLARRVGQPGAAQAVGSDGGIGGFGGGLETKRQLLALEGVLPEPLF